SKGGMRALEDTKVAEADQLSFLNCTDSTERGLLDEASTLEDSEALNLDRDVGGINNPKISGIIQDSTATILSNLEKRHRELKKSVASSSADKDKQKDIGSGVMVSSSFLTYINLGKPSVVTKTTRPALDQKKLMAVKNYMIKICNLHPGTFEIWDTAEFDRRIKNVCSDARKKLASKQKKFE
ncbi:unnamed protein product, partial [Allacma fusca]